MTETKHTPEPWELDTPKGVRALVDSAYTIWKDGIQVATVSLRPHASKGEELPNARLLTAAPRLLTALRDLAKSLDTMLNNDPITYDADSAALQVMLRNARVAIAKAEGLAAHDGQ